MAAGCNNRCYAFQTHTRQVYASLPGAAITTHARDPAVAALPGAAVAPGHAVGPGRPRSRHSRVSAGPRGPGPLRLDVVAATHGHEKARGQN